MESSNSFSQFPLTPYQVYDRVVRDNVLSAIVQAIGTAIVYWLAGVWRLIAILVFAVLSLITLWEVPQVVFLTGAGAVAFVMGIRDRSLPRESGWMWAANVVRIASAAFSIYLLSIIYASVAVVAASLSRLERCMLRSDLGRNLVNGPSHHRHLLPSVWSGVLPGRRFVRTVWRPGPDWCPLPGRTAVVTRRSPTPGRIVTVLSKPEHLPWRGPAYSAASPRLLLLGKAHYGVQPTDDSPEFTQELIRRVRDSDAREPFVTKPPRWWRKRP